MVKPDLEVVRIPPDRSFKVWSHGYPFRTVRWHLHPEYELHLVTATTGTRYVGDHIGPFVVGDLVLVGPNLPHNWISDVKPGETVEERCIVLMFTEEFISSCLATFPEPRFIERMLIAEEAALDGLYAVRTSWPKATLEDAEAVAPTSRSPRWSARFVV